MDSPRRSIWWRWAAAMLAGLALVYPLAWCSGVLAKAIVMGLKPWLLTIRPDYAAGTGFEGLKEGVSDRISSLCWYANLGALLGLAGLFWKIAKSPAGLEFGRALRLIVLWFFVADLFQVTYFFLGWFWPWWEEGG